jgi:hypothetical protein
MSRAKRVFGTACLFAFLMGVFGWVNKPASAQEPVSAQETIFAQLPASPENPSRLTTILVSYTEYEWWLISWQNNEVLCQVYADHEGLPTTGEVTKGCGEEAALAWNTTPPCKAIAKNNDSTNCNGLYMFLVSSQPKERQVVVELPPPAVWVDLEGCTLVPPENRCSEIPTLVLTGEEPLPNERIIDIQGIFDGQPFSCPESICKLTLLPTPLEGSQIEFWADSSFGDSSAHFTAQVRVIDTGVVPAPNAAGWYIDVISSQWRGTPLASCARIWEVFPPVGGPPPWLSTPEGFDLLASDEPYYYLAGRLITQGLVDVSECPTGGMLPNGYADACGLEKARPMVEEWQNQFDNRILEVANDTGIPAQLIKNLFAQESQFWAGVFRVPFEFGLGQLTDNGADSILIWTPSFFDQLCPLVLAENACAGGYLNLNTEDRAILRGALALQAKADCPTCPEGIDLSNVNFTVSLFANILQANCAQVSRTIYTATNQIAGGVATYEDLWRFTIANYHAGPGCLSYAIHQAWEATQQLTWEEVASRFTDPCMGVVPYVEKITH